jgi:hypothetical protein
MLWAGRVSPRAPYHGRVHCILSHATKPPFSVLVQRLLNCAKPVVPALCRRKRFTAAPFRRRGKTQGARRSARREGRRHARGRFLALPERRRKKTFPATERRNYRLRAPKNNSCIHAALSRQMAV